MHRWNPLCKGFILSHFGWVCCVGQHRVLIHTIVRKSRVKYCKKRTKSAPRQERVEGFYLPLKYDTDGVAILGFHLTNKEICTIAGSYSFGIFFYIYQKYWHTNSNVHQRIFYDYSWQLQVRYLVAISYHTVALCIKYCFLCRFLVSDLSSCTIKPWRPLLRLAPLASRW